MKHHGLMAFLSLRHRRRPLDETGVARQPTVGSQDRGHQGLHCRVHEYVDELGDVMGQELGDYEVIGRHHRASRSTVDGEGNSGDLLGKLENTIPLPPATLPFGKVRQVFRVVRERTVAKTGETSAETAYGITSVGRERAGPERLLAWKRGHWQVENGNHFHATSCSPSSSTAASGTCPRPTATT